MAQNRRMFFSIQTHRFPLNQSLNTQAEELWHLCFHKDRTPEEQANHEDRFCGKRDRFLYVYALEQEAIIGSVTALKRTIIFQANTIVLGGIGAVCTHPDKRRQGVSSALLKVAMESLSQEGCQLAHLCTDIKEEGAWLYSKVGFVPLGRSYIYLGQSGKRYQDDDGMIAPLSSLQIFQAILEDLDPFDIGIGNW